MVVSIRSQYSATPYPWSSGVGPDEAQRAEADGVARSWLVLNSEGTVAGGTMSRSKTASFDSLLPATYTFWSSLLAATALAGDAVGAADAVLDLLEVNQRAVRLAFEDGDRALSP